MNATAASQLVGRGLLFIIANGALLYACLRAAHRLLPRAGAHVRVVASAVLFIAGVVALAQFLSVFALYRPVPAAAIAAFLGALMARVVPANGVGVRADASALRARVESVARSRGGVVLVLCLLTVSLALWRALEYPPLGWDSLTYHLVFAGSYVQNARLGTFAGPFAMDVYAHLPKNGEILASWAMLPFHSDLIVGVVNVALLVFGWLATYGLARELDLGPGDAALGATAVCASPFLYSYVTTQNPDTLVFAALVSAVLFVIRHAREGQRSDAWLACAGIGIAIGAKYTALPLAALMLCSLLIAAITGRRVGKTSRFAVWTLAVLMTVGLLGGRQYILNAIETGNPVYPLGVRVGGRVLFQESPYSERLAVDKGTGDRRMDLSQFVRTFNYFPDWRTPTSAGPKYLVLIPLAFVALLAKGFRHRRCAALLVAAAVVACVVSYIPGSGFAALSRRFWPGSAPRFLAAPFAIFAIVGLTAGSRLSGWRSDALRAVIVAFIVWDFIQADTRVAAKVPWAFGLAGLGCALVAVWRPWRLRVHTAVIVGALTGIGLLAIPFLSQRRIESRWRYYATATDVHEIPRAFVHGWEYCDRLPDPATIALTGGWDSAGQNYFFYPLMGSRLQHHVTYVPVRQDAAPASRDFVLRDGARLADWLGGLDARGVTHVFVQSPWPIEDTWMRGRPDTFSLRADDAGFRLYAVNLAPSPKTDQTLRQVVIMSMNVMYDGITLKERRH